jgi:hypothetical protein
MPDKPINRRHVFSYTGAVGALLLAVVLIFSNNQLAYADFTTQGALTVSSTTNNVGIGSTAPGQALDVNGTVRMTGFILTGNGAGNGNVLVVNSVGVGTWMASTTLNVTATATPAGPVPALQYDNNGAMGGVSGSGADANGNIGIGTGGPVEKLAVVGNVGIGTQSYSKYITTTPTASGLVTEGNVGIGTWKIDNAGLSVMNGNVGIGTWAPQAAMQVVGDIDIINPSGDMGLYLFDNTKSWGFQRTGNFFHILGYGNANQAFDIVDSKTNTRRFTVQLDTGNVGIGTFNPFGGNLIVNGGGNVGIGSLTPGQTLDVNGTARLTGLTLSNNGAGNGFVMVGNSVGVGTWMATTTLNVTATATPAGPVPSLQYDNNGVTGAVSGSGADANGNIGIGTSGPLEKLAVLGNIGIGTVTYSKYLTVAAPSGGLIVEGNVGIGTWLPSQRFEVGTQDLDITSGGNVGIGTIAPTNVEIEGLNVGIGTFRTTTSALTVMSGNVGIGTWVPAAGLDVETSGNVYFGGNVGIGTVTPGATLDVTGTGRFSSNVGIGTSNANFKLEIGGCVTKEGSNACTDLAELITSSQAVSQGDIVALDPARPVTVIKATSRDNGLLFGVVTTNPAIIMEGSRVGILNGKIYDPDPHKPAIALAGRIPVKVNLENGPISEGDMITASSVPGIGAKAVKPSRVIGMGLEPLVDLKGRPWREIYVYVNPHWWQDTTLMDEEIRRLKNEFNSRMDKEDKEVNARLEALERKILKAGRRGL